MHVDYQRNRADRHDVDYVSFVVQVGADTYTRTDLLGGNVSSGEDLTLDVSVGPIPVYAGAEVKIVIVVTNFADRDDGNDALVDAGDVTQQVAGFVRLAGPWLTALGLPNVAVITGTLADIADSVGAFLAGLHVACDGPVFKYAHAYSTAHLDEMTAQMEQLEVTTGLPREVTTEEYTEDSQQGCGHSPETTMKYKIYHHAKVPPRSRSAAAGGAAAPSGERQELFWVTVAGDVLTTHWDYSTMGFDGWTVPPAQISGAAAKALADTVVAPVSRTHKQMDAFWVGQDRSIWTCRRDLANGPAWTPPSRLAGIRSFGSGDQVAAVARSKSWVDVFWIGTDSKVWWVWGEPASGAYSAPIPIDSGPASNAVAAVSAAPGEVTVFWISGGAIYARTSKANDPNSWLSRTTVHVNAAQVPTALAAVAVELSPPQGKVRVLWTTSLGRVLSRQSISSTAATWSPVEDVAPQGSAAEARIYAVTEIVGSNEIRVHAYWPGEMLSIQTATRNILSGTAWTIGLVRNQTGTLLGATHRLPLRHDVFWTTDMLNAQNQIVRRPVWAVRQGGFGQPWGSKFVPGM